jgi:CO/xanthine dehydrogenase Mo-binding subunit
VPRVDGAAKVRGTAAYVDDLHVPGALFGATVRSETARAHLRKIRLDPAFDWTGITVATSADIPGENIVALIEDDQPLLASNEIRHVYEPVALLACDDPVRLERAKKAVALDVEPLPPVLSMDASTRVQKSYVIEHNCSGPAPTSDAGGGGKSIDDLLASCDVVLSGRYSVHHQEQLYIEPQGMIARWDADGVHVTGSLQCPFYVHKAMKRAFALDGDRVHIAQAVTGGGFGGKEEYPSVLAMHAALLAKLAGKPVRMIYGRKEDIEATTKRHPARVDVTSGCTKSGELVALKIECLMDGGAYATLTPVVLSRGILHSAGAYRWKHARICGRAVATNTPPNGAFRGFGAPQTIWAIERHMDRLAGKLRMDPLDLRKKNVLRIGDVTVTGQTLTESVGVEECIERAVKESGYVEKRARYGTRTEGRKRRGVGAAVFMHGAGFTGSGERRLKGKVQVDHEPSGRLRIRTASTDIGQGTETVFRQIAADAAGVPIESVDFEQPCTTHVPDSGPTVASRTVMVVGSIVAKAAEEVARKGPGSTALVEYEPPVKNQWNDDTYRGDAYPCYAWACDVAEVEVDLDTFETKVLGFWAAQDIGKAIHPVMCAGQVEGGTLQAIGWALYENVVWSKDGRILNPRMTNYVIPTSKDAPPFVTTLVEHPFSGGPNGAKGVGELPMDGGAPAIAAAVEQAIGAECNDLPLLPEDLFYAVKRCS